MSLASRLCGFFVTALAVVLVGFSAAFYALAAEYLHRQVDERLDAALAKGWTVVDMKADWKRVFTFDSK